MDAGKQQGPGEARRLAMDRLSAARAVSAEARAAPGGAAATAVAGLWAAGVWAGRPASAVTAELSGEFGANTPK